MKNSSMFFLRTLIASVFFISLSLGTILAQNKVLTNKEWQQLFGNPLSDIEWSASTLDASGNILTTGNTVDASSSVNLFISKRSPSGETIWEQEYAAQNSSKSYGIALTTDEFGNIYIVGVTFNSEAQNHDYLVLKYSSNGVLQWYYSYNGSDNGEDFPTSIDIDITDNYSVYVTGTSYSELTNYDYLTLKLDNNGNLNWMARYDNNSLPDAAISIQATEGKVFVSGGASTTITDRNYVHLSYDGNTGNQLSIAETGVIGTGLETPSAISVENGNFAITGSGGLGQDCYTVFLDGNFNIIWEAWYDGFGMNDQPFDIKIDDENNVYVCGYTEKSTNINDLLVLKYDNTGNLLWSKQRSARNPIKSSQASFLEIDEDNKHIVVVGEEEGANSTSYLKAIRYDDSGQLLWEDVQDDNATVIDRATSLSIDKESKDVVITGTTTINNEQYYQALKYKHYSSTLEYDYVDGNPVRVDGEIIIRFYPTVVDTTFADNADLIFGEVDEIITDDALINLMDEKLGGGGKLKNWTMAKMFPFVSTSGRTFVSNYGSIVPINSVWTTYKLFLEGSMSEQSSVDALNELEYYNILYATVNTVGKLEAPPPNTPNDTHYSFQAGLHPVDGFENAHINIEEAWDKVVGSPLIKVGFVDSGLNFGHPEFGNSYSGLGGSIVEAGYNFLNPMTEPIQYDDTGTDSDLNSGHGTRLAGIVGALRNNNLGISGIAGGDIDGGNGPGVGLLFFKVISAQVLNAASANSAYFFAATGPDGSGNMVDVLNNSYSWTPSPGDDGQFHIQEYLTPAYKSGMISLFARGNNELSTDDIRFPGSINDRMLINVGGSGIDGMLKETLANSSSEAEVLPTGEQFMSLYGKSMDFIAPATSNLILTTNNLQDPSTLPGPSFIVGCDTPLASFSGNEDYSCFNGTSSATAIASGVAALLLEKHQNDYGIRLTQEDVEKLMEYGSTDLEGAGYDDRNGWGRLNAGESINLISNSRKVVHFQVIPDTEIECDEGCGLELTHFYESAFSNYEDTGIFPEGYHDATTVIKHTYDININFCSSYNSQLFDPGIETGKTPVWLVNSRSNLWGRVEDEEPTEVGYYISRPEDHIYWEEGPNIDPDGCVLTGTMAGYSYVIDNGAEEVPNNGSPYQMWFSVLVDDPTGVFDDDVTNVEVQNLIDEEVILFPNPATSELNIFFSGEEDLEVSALHVYDLNGKLVQNISDNSFFQANNKWQINTIDLRPGVYILAILSEGKYTQRKFIKK